MRAGLRIVAPLFVAFSVFAVVSFAYAQTTPDEMHATITAALLSDPRTANVPPAQLQQLVNEIADQAQVQGLGPKDIQWQVNAAAQTFASNAPQQSQAKCAGLFPSLCPFSQAFGFEGNDVTTPLILFVTSALLLLMLYEIIKHHKKKLENERVAASIGVAH